MEGSLYLKCQRYLLTHYKLSFIKLPWSLVLLTKIAGTQPVNNSLHGHNYIKITNIAGKGVINKDTMCVVTRDMRFC